MNKHYFFRMFIQSYLVFNKHKMLFIHHSWNIFLKHFSYTLLITTCFRWFREHSKVMFSVMLYDWSPSRLFSKNILVTLFHKMNKKSTWGGQDILQKCSFFIIINSTNGFRTAVWVNYEKYLFLGDYTLKSKSLGKSNLGIYVHDL